MSTALLFRSFIHAPGPELSRARVGACSLALVLSANLASCGGEATAPPVEPPPPPTVASVAITPETPTLHAVGETVQLTATARRANGTAIPGKTFTWTSLDETVATVSVSGQVTAKALGTATINATTDGVVGTNTVQVQLLSATVDVGPDGGEVEIQGFSLTVPAGAFDAVYELSVDTTSADGLFGDDRVTNLFRLGGLPDEYSQPLRVRIKYEGMLAQESFVAYGAAAFDALARDSTKAYRLFSAVDSMGYLVSDLPVPQGAATVRTRDNHQASANALNLDDITEWLGVTGHRTHTTEHFRIRFPASNVGGLDINAFGDMLEESRNTVINDLQFNFSPYGWPMQVVVSPDYDYATVRVYSSVRGRVMYVNQAGLSSGDSTLVRIRLGRELLGVSVGADDQDDEIWDPANFWLYAAVLAWAEEAFTDRNDYRVPRGFPGKEMMPFHGMRAGAGPGNDPSLPWWGNPDLTTSSLHGVGMSSMIKFLVEDPRFGVNALRHTYDAGRGTAALLGTVNAPVEVWWPDFLAKYVGGEVYGVSAAVFTDSENVAGVWSIENENDTQKEFVVGYPDLSAKLFLIDLDYTDIDESAKMVLEVSSEEPGAPLSIIVFGRKDGPLEHFGRGSGSDDFALQLDGLRSLIEDGWNQLLVVVVNSFFDDSPPSPYTWSSIINLAIGVAKPVKVTEALTITEEDAGCKVASAPESTGEMTITLDTQTQEVSLVFDGSGSGHRIDVGCIPEEFDLDWSVAYSGEFHGSFDWEQTDVARFTIGGWANWHVTRKYSSCTPACPPDVDLQRPELMSFVGTVNVTTGESTGTIDLPGMPRASGTWGN